MRNIVVYYNTQISPQNLLRVKYNSNYDPATEPNPKDFIKYDEETGIYDFIVVAMYPHVYAVNGKKSLVTYKVTDAQRAFIQDMPNAIKILADCDNNPDTDYVWYSPEAGNQAKFEAVAGADFFTGSGTIGDEDYIAPRKKLAVLAS